MTLTIGRCALGDSVDISTVRRNGNSLRLSGTFRPTVDGDTNHSAAVRQQLAGLVDNDDEDAFPLTFAVDPTLDGYYRVGGIDIAERPASPDTGAFTYTLQLERISTYTTPWWELTATQVLRSNPHGITVPHGVSSVSLSDGSQTVSHDPGALAALFPSPSVRLASDGVCTAYTAAPHATLATWQICRPQAFYGASARLELLYGSTWYPVTGTQVPAGYLWRLSNGVVRLTAANGATSGTFEVWNGSAWESANVRLWGLPGYFGIGASDDYPSVGAANPPISVIRNGPEHVAIRTSTFATRTTYSIQRGAMHVVISAEKVNVPTLLGVGHGSAVASTAITGGIISTANNAQGNRLIFANTAAITTDLVNGYIARAAFGTSINMIGVELDGTAAVASKINTQIRDEFFGATSWRQRLVRS